MPRLATLALALVALSGLATSACTAESTDTDPEDFDADEIEVRPAGTTRPPGYHIAATGTHYQWLQGDDVQDWDVFACSMFSNGVVRSWALKEKNARDFRYSKHVCRDVLSNGTLSDENDSTYHFYHEGSGTVGTTYTPMDMIPVGVRIQAWSALGSLTYKISDVAMVYKSAADVVAHYNGITAASYALGRNDSTFTITCPAGYALTGLGVHEVAGSGGPDQSEITGLKIRCSEMTYD